MATGLVLVGVRREEAMTLSAEEITIVLKAYDQASAEISRVEASTNRLNSAFTRVSQNASAIREAYDRQGMLEAVRLEKDATLRVSLDRVYQVGESGPELFVPHTPAPSLRTDIDHRQLAEAISRAIQQMPPPRIVQ